MSKTHRLTAIAREVIAVGEGSQTDVLDPSLLTSEPADRFTRATYERWTAAHGVMVLTPAYWFESPSVLKHIIDGSSLPPSAHTRRSTIQGKDPKRAKALELKGCSYPQHLAGWMFGVVVHGDVEHADSVRRSLVDWQSSVGLIDAGAFVKHDRYMGCYEPYATSHDALDRDQPIQEELRNVTWRARWWQRWRCATATRLIRTSRSPRLGPSSERASVAS